MRRQLVGFAVLGAISVAVLAAPASSAPPTGLASYSAGSTAYAVDLDAALLDVELLASLTDAEVVSTGPTASAGGGALVIGDQILGGPEETCPLALPAPIDAVVADIGCITTVTESDADPRATATSEEIVLVLGGSDLSNQVLTPLREAVIDQLGTAVGDVISGLGLPGLPELETALDNVLDTLSDPAGSTVRVTLAPTNSAASADETGVLARSAAAGLIIEVVPALFGEPPAGITSCAASQALLCAQISGSVAEVRRDPVTGVATTSGTAAQLVDFLVAPQLGSLLGTALPQVAAALNGAVAQLADSSPLACGVDGPLADLICLDGAATDELDAAEAAAFGFDYGEGTVGSRASALRVELLRVAEGGIVLALNEAVAAANAAAVAAPATVPPTTAPPTLARTGGTDFPLALVTGLGGVAVAGALLVRRAAVKP